MISCDIHQLLCKFLELKYSDFSELHQCVLPIFGIDYARLSNAVIRPVSGCSYPESSPDLYDRT